MLRVPRREAFQEETACCTRVHMKLKVLQSERPLHIAVEHKKLV